LLLGIIENVDDLEPICLFVTSFDIQGPDQENIGKAVRPLLAEFKLIRTPNPFVWFFLGRWRASVSAERGDRITRLLDSLKSVDGIILVTVSFAWTTFMQNWHMAWKTWREIIS
jgi:hypothetical protein